jgi:hypothetical protein
MKGVKKMKKATLFFVIIDLAISSYGAMVGYWNFDEGQGTIAFDTSGNENYGMIYGNPKWIEGIVGRAIEFDGIDDIVVVQDAPSLDVTSELTISAWIKFYRTFTGTLQGIVYKWAYNGNERSYALVVGPTEHLGVGFQDFR